MSCLRPFALVELLRCKVTRWNSAPERVRERYAPVEQALGQLCCSRRASPTLLHRSLAKQVNLINAFACGPGNQLCHRSP